MSAMSDYLEDKLRIYIFRGEAFTQPTNLYVALFTAAPSDAGGGTEVSGGSYARVTVACNTGNWTKPDSTGGAVNNTNAITFPTATGSWGTCTHFGIFDASSGGNLLFWGALTASKTIGNGDVISFAAAALVVTFA